MVSAGHSGACRAFANGTGLVFDFASERFKPVVVSLAGLGPLSSSLAIFGNPVMNLVAPLSGYFLWFTLAVSIFSFGWILRVAPWRSLAAIPVRQHMWFGVIIGLGIYGALVQLQLFNLFRLHPLLMAACTAIFGARLTIIA